MIVKSAEKQNKEKKKIKCKICQKKFLLSKYARERTKCCSKKCSIKWWRKQNKKRIYEYQKKYINEPINKIRLRKIKNEYERKNKKELRKKIIQKFGGVCVICGFSDWRALQVDHVNGGGTREIKLKFNKNRSKYYKYLFIEANNNKNYQLLCANCNWIKKYEQNETNSKRLLDTGK